MSLIIDSLAIALGTANANVSSCTAITIPEPPSLGLDNDQTYAREQLMNVIHQTSQAIANLTLIAAASQHPRAYEVLEKLLMRHQDAATKLLELHNARADINKKNRDAGTLPTGNVNQTYIANAVFTGTTAELLAKLKGTPEALEVLEHDDLLDLDE